MLADELEGRAGADLGDGIEVVAPEEDAEVDELGYLSACAAADGRHYGIRQSG